MKSLNEYVIQNAGSCIGVEFVQEFGATEVFFSIQELDESLKDGPMLILPGVDLKIRTGQLEIGQVAVFYTSPSDVRLADRFGGLSLIKAVELVAQIPSLSGMLIQSDGDAWFAADMQALKHVMAK